MTVAHSVTARFDAICIVPQLVGMKLASALRAVLLAGCRNGKITRAFSRRVAVGRVMSSLPKADAHVPVGTFVRVTVSKGRKKAA